MTLRTIEADATVTAERTLVVAVPADVLPGSYRVVVVFTAAEPDEDVGLRTSEDPWDALARIGAELSAQGPVSPSASEDLMAGRR
jgi:hypothetical protein